MSSSSVAHAVWGNAVLAQISTGSGRAIAQPDSISLHWLLTAQEKSPDA